MEIPIVDATEAAVAAFGTVISTEVTHDIDIPFYRGRVAEGGDIEFRYRGRAALRTAQIFPTDEVDEVLWLERHLHLTQLFVDISGAPFVMVLAPPNHDLGAQLPDLDRALALRFPPSSALLLHAGTWHDFPIAEDRPVTVLVGNSKEVVDALQRGGPPGEMDEGDVWKISLAQRFGTTIRPVIDIRKG
jgi:ureidoglycolate lyase